MWRCHPRLSLPDCRGLTSENGIPLIASATPSVISWEQFGLMMSSRGFRITKWVVILAQSHKSSIGRERLTIVILDDKRLSGCEDQMDCVSRQQSRAPLPVAASR